MREIFEENNSKLLLGSMIWTPMLESDNLEAAKECEAVFSDSRVTHFWDPDRILGRMLSRTLNLRASIAWDVYLIYPPGRRWGKGSPPAPEFWMHQLDENPELLLDPLQLRRTVKTVIEGMNHR